MKTQLQNNEMNMTAWQQVQTARETGRPCSMDYINQIFDGFLELHGDRLYGDDRAVIGGIAAIDGTYVTVIGQQKGKTQKEKKYRNYGMPNPEGYRKALRLMKQAEKFGRPVILFVDTPGAFCGVEAEEHGQGEAIARNLFEMAALKIPVLTIIIGEGGSGGALAMAVANEVWMLEHAVYSILSPEGFASILWKDGKRAEEAAEVMKLTAADLKAQGIIEQILPEEAGVLRAEIAGFLKKNRGKTGEELAGQRYERFRRYGAFSEEKRRTDR